MCELLHTTPVVQKNDGQNKSVTVVTVAETAASGHAAAPPSRVMNSRRFVCREKSIVRGDGGSVMTVFLSRPEARSRFG